MAYSYLQPLWMVNLDWQSCKVYGQFIFQRQNFIDYKPDKKNEVDLPWKWEWTGQCSEMEESM